MQRLYEIIDMKDVNKNNHEFLQINLERKGTKEDNNTQQTSDRKNKRKVMTGSKETNQARQRDMMTMKPTLIMNLLTRKKKKNLKKENYKNN